MAPSARSFRSIVYTTNYSNTPNQVIVYYYYVDPKIACIMSDAASKEKVEKAALIDGHFLCQKEEARRAIPPSTERRRMDPNDAPKHVCIALHEKSPPLLS